MDLSTTYLGLTLRNPVVVSPSPLSEDVANIKRMDEAGAGAVVLHSLFEEQIRIEAEELDRNLTIGELAGPDAATFFPDLSSYRIGPEQYLYLIRKAKSAVGIPVIASLNGVSAGGWTGYAKKIEEAGADALELNVYTIPASPEMSSAQVEDQYAQLVREVCSAVRIPVAVKLGSYFSAMASLAARLEAAGAKGLVLFNRFYQPDFDLEKLEIVPRLELSNSSELLQRLHWAAILYGKIKADVAITGGVHTAEDVLKSMMAGAKVAMMTSAILKNGIGHISTVLKDMMAWMQEREYESVRQMQGSMSQKSVKDPDAFLRANYLRVLSSYAATAR
ncbi:MAG: dihydroorotate dehydrogenase-like protein [bacterium]